LTEPLPITLDVRKAAARGVTVSGVLRLSELTRLMAALASDRGHIEAKIDCDRDEENRFVAEVKVQAEVEVLCQRCLESMPITLATDNRLAIVGDDDKAKQLPSHLEPWVVEEDQGELWLLVEDEIMLGLPIVSYHESKECKEILKGYNTPAPVAEEVRENPFNVLEQLKPGNK